MSEGLIASEYNPETSELTVTGKATPEKYAQEMSKILFFNSSDTPAAGNRTFEISVNDGRDEGVSKAVTHTLYLSYAKNVATDGPAKTVERSRTFKFLNGLCISNIYHFWITNV